ncbi:MAG: TonB-dependent receptor [Alteromonadaceae bacterium]|uniref:TonB-dependent receptor n=1 Tax=Paraglaciecola chathamensis TaxID=368405 RepID=UPI000C632B0A|nr:TonB-dependent receptor [Paraglaciecola agarilytica]MBN25564.1 TonB-dependent receptor [Alteromonadaceae bacterium]|tara:strand:+ start:96414 stop:98597 length:2184 start_codon:yes stop_codon:yes gene_type:complete
MKVINKSNLMAYSLLSLSIASPSAYVAAQESKKAKNDREEMEVIVTVNKRKESLLKVSGSVQVMGENLLQDFKLDDMDAVVDFIPNATFSAAPSGTPVLAIRGIGTRAGGAMLEQDVGLFIDGVWAGRNNQMQAGLMDIEAIEVLKGTQATLYGRNALVGVVSVTTKKPEGELEGNVKAGYEFENSSTSIEGGLSLPITDDFSVRIAGMHEEIGGWVKNEGVGRDEAENTNDSIRLTGVYYTDAEWIVTGKVQVTEQEQIGNSAVRLLEGTFTEYDGTDSYTPAAEPAAALLGYSENAFGVDINAPVILNSDIGSQRDFVDTSLQLDIPMGEHTLTAISGFNQMDYQSAFDPSILGGPRVVSWYDEDYEQFSQELRLTSPSGENFDYIVGLFYVQQTIDRLTFQYLNDDKRFWYGEQDMDAISAFASGTYRLNDDTRLIAGLRYTQENKDADIIVLGSNEDPDEFAQASDSVDESTLDGSLTLEWSASDALLLYAGVATGSKRPGLASGNPVNNADFVNSTSLFIPTEEIVTIEAGFKYQLENGYINSSIFDMDISDFQNAGFSNGNIVISSFDVKSRGIEIDSFYYLTDSITMVTGLGFMDVEDTTNDADVSGAPKFSANMTFTYESEELADDLYMRASVNINHKSSHWLNETSGESNQFNEIDAVTLLNASISLINSAYKVALYTKNLTDEEYADFSFNAPGANNDYYFSVAQGRTIGVEASYFF